MTLDEAIKHCKEKVEHLRNGVRTCQSMSATEQADCLECANEHEQLAEWLEELKDWRKLKPVCAFDGYVVYTSRSEVSISEIEAYCDTCKHRDGYPTSDVCQYCGAFHHYERDEAIGGKQ